MMMEGEEEATPRVWLVLLLAFFAACGVVLDVLACVFWGGWWLILVAVIFALLPLPAFFSKRYGDPFNDSSYGKDIAHFWTGLLGSSGLGLPLMLLHSGYVLWTGVLVGLLGGVVIGSSVTGFLYFFYNQKPDF